MRRRVEARLKFSSSAIATQYRRCRSSIRSIPMRYRTVTNYVLDCKSARTLSPHNKRRREDARTAATPRRRDMRRAFSRRASRPSITNSCASAACAPRQIGSIRVDVHQNYIGGRWTPSRATVAVLNPSDGAKMAEIARGGAAEIDAAVAAGH
ncbi:MAG: hypothetical protein KDJ12_10955, partial [Hyphomicrobiales bacterium]|nr:hypothetical protein [Hyphomicrobiales bacterium]